MPFAVVPGQVASEGQSLTLATHTILQVTMAGQAKDGSV